jgi:lysylphosphatidylglycerol synthetase-like protein (DUF2156 family)
MHAIVSVTLAGLSIVLLALHFLLAGVVGLVALVVAASGIGHDARYRLAHRLAATASVVAMVASLALSLTLLRTDRASIEVGPAVRVSD